MDDIQGHMNTWRRAMDDTSSESYESALEGFASLQRLDSTHDRMLRNLQNNHALAGWGLLAQKYPAALIALKSLLQTRIDEQRSFPLDTARSANISEIERHIHAASRPG